MEPIQWVVSHARRCSVTPGGQDNDWFAAQPVARIGSLKAEIRAIRWITSGTDSAASARVAVAERTGKSAEGAGFRRRRGHGPKEHPGARAESGLERPALRLGRNTGDVPAVSGAVAKMPGTEFESVELPEGHSLIAVARPMGHHRDDLVSRFGISGYHLLSYSTIICRSPTRDRLHPKRSAWPLPEPPPLFIPARRSDRPMAQHNLRVSAP